MSKGNGKPSEEQLAAQADFERKLNALPHESEFQEYVCPKCQGRLFQTATKIKHLSKFDPKNTLLKDVDMPLKVNMCAACKTEVIFDGPYANAILMNSLQKIIVPQ